MHVGPDHPLTAKVAELCPSQSHPAALPILDPCALLDNIPIGGRRSTRMSKPFDLDSAISGLIKFWVHVHAPLANETLPLNQDLFRGWRYRKQSQGLFHLSYI